MTPRLHSPKGDGPKAAYGTLVGICRLRRGFLFPEGRMLVAVGAVPPGRGARGRCGGLPCCVLITLLKHGSCNLESFEIIWITLRKRAGHRSINYT